MKFLFVFILLLISLIQVKSQDQITKLREWPAKEVNDISVDRLGNFFLVFKKGGIKKYDPDGKEMASLKKMSPTLLEPWYHPAIFIYDRSSQVYDVYGRHFENKKVNRINPAFAIEPYLVCPTSDNKLWIFDKADYSLKHVNPITDEVLKEFTLEINNAKPEFTFIKEYQNLIFLREKNEGIWIVNSLGEILNKIQIKGSGNFNFFGQELYYLENNVLYFINLVTEERYEIALPGEVRFALITDERILTVLTNRKISLYNYIPQQ